MIIIDMAEGVIMGQKNPLFSQSKWNWNRFWNNEKKKEISGGEPHTTNNRMELMAVIEGLQALKRPCEVTLYSDSKYLVDMVEGGYLNRWKKNNWMRNKKDPVKNVDLWEKIFQLLQVHDVKMIWVKGHAENPWNNRCDELAVAAAAKFQQ